MPGASICKITGPVAIFDVPIRVAGSKRNPLIGQCNPSDTPPTGPRGNKDTVSPSSVGSVTSDGQRNVISLGPSTRQGRSGRAASP